MKWYTHWWGVELEAENDDEKMLLLLVKDSLREEATQDYECTSEVRLEGGTKLVIHR